MEVGRRWGVVVNGFVGFVTWARFCYIYRVGVFLWGIIE